MTNQKNERYFLPLYIWLFVSSSILKKKKLKIREETIYFLNKK